MLIADMKEGEDVVGVYAVKKKLEIKKYKNKPGEFFVLLISDKTGSVLLKYWGRDEDTDKLYSEIEEGMAIEVEAVVGYDKYSQASYVSVDAEAGLIKKAEGEKATDLIKKADNIEEMFSELAMLIDSVVDSYLKNLLTKFFSDDSIVDDFKLCPGSMSGVYDYLGGLLEHTLKVAELCNSMSVIFDLDRDVLMTGAILHDIGKLQMYKWGASIEITQHAKFVGHPAIGYRMVEEKIKEIEDFPSSTADKLLHLILAHHSRVEDNVPERLKIKEAFALFHANELDRHLKEFDVESEEDWFFSKRLHHEVFLK